MSRFKMGLELAEEPRKMEERRREVEDGERKRWTTNGRGSGSGGVLEFGRVGGAEEMNHEWTPIDTHGK